MTKTLKKLPLYPFLIAIYPILYYVSTNIGEVTPMAGLRAALIFLALSLLAFLFFRLVSKNTQQSALYTLVVVLVFFLIFFILYAPAYRTLREVVFMGQPLGRHRNLVLASALLLAAVSALLLVFGKRLPKKWLNNIALFANLIALFLTILPVVTIVSAMIKEKQAISQSSADLPEITELAVTQTTDLPDIYYIVLDMNTNENVMRQLIDYDDSGFTRALEETGFYVSSCSQSNYNSTRQALTSSLNLDYLDNLDISGGEAGMYPLMQQSRVRRMLEDIGYSTYAFKTGYSFLDLKTADHYSDPTRGALNLITYPGITTFESLILSVSAGQVLYENRDSLSSSMQTLIDAPYMRRRAEIFNVMDSLPEIAKEEGPKFIYAHVLAPHDPFVFDENGDPAFRRYPFTENGDPEFGAGYGWDAYKKGYADEVTYLHGAIIAMIDQILANSETPPIIILQGDHGIPYTTQFNAEFQILNAYYFPGITSAGFYDTISPVNSFRLLFKDYFGTDFSLLEDKAYFTNEDFTFTEFSEVFPCQ